MRATRGLLCYHWDTLVNRPTILLERKNPQERLRYQLHWEKQRRGVEGLVEELAGTGKVGIAFARDVRGDDWGMVLEKLSQTAPGKGSKAREHERALVEQVARKLLGALEQGERLENPAAALLGFGRLAHEFQLHGAVDGPPAQAYLPPSEGAMRSASLVGKLLVEVYDARDRLHAHEVTAALQGAHLARVPPPPALTLALLQRAVEADSLPQVVAVDVMYLLRAAEVLPSQHREELKAVVTALGEHVVTRLAATFTPLQVAASLRSLAVLGLPHEGLVQVLAERLLAEHILDSLSGEEAAAAVHALGALGGVGDLPLTRVPVERLGPSHGSKARFDEIGRLRDEFAILPVTGDIVQLPKLADKRSAYRNDAWSPKYNWHAGTDTAVWSVQRMVAHSVLRRVLADRRTLGSTHAAMLLQGCAALGYAHPERTWALEHLLHDAVQSEAIAAGGHGAALVANPGPFIPANPLLGRRMALDPILKASRGGHDALPPGAWTQLYFEYRTQLKGIASHSSANALPPAREGLLDALTEAASGGRLLAASVDEDRAGPPMIWTDGQLWVLEGDGAAEDVPRGEELVVKQPPAAKRVIRSGGAKDPRKVLRRAWSLIEGRAGAPSTAAPSAGYEVIQPPQGKVEDKVEDVLVDEVAEALAARGAAVEAVHRNVDIAASRAGVYRLRVAACYTRPDGAVPVLLIVPDGRATPAFEVLCPREDSDEGALAAHGPAHKYHQQVQHMVRDSAAVVAAPLTDLLALDADDRKRAVNAAVAAMILDTSAPALPDDARDPSGTGRGGRSSGVNSVKRKKKRTKKTPKVIDLEPDAVDTV